MSKILSLFAVAALAVGIASPALAHPAHHPVHHAPAVVVVKHHTATPHRKGLHRPVVVARHGRTPHMMARPMEHAVMVTRPIPVRYFTSRGHRSLNGELVILK